LGSGHNLGRRSIMKKLILASLLALSAVSTFVASAQAWPCRTVYGPYGFPHQICSVNK
jgi:hypothetical protein